MTLRDQRVCVVGASGFVGRAVLSALENAGSSTRPVSAPRLTSESATPEGIVEEAREWCRTDGEPLIAALSGSDVMVNCAGLAQPGSADVAGLTGANALLPAVLAVAAASAGVRRLVHVSSAAVQGRMPVLTETDDLAPFSPYSRSKALGEQALVLAAADSSTEAVRYRATSVHGHDRPTTQQLGRLARSRLAAVAGRGADPTPQVLVEDVARAVVLLVVSPTAPSRPVLHPWEGLTTAGFLTVLGLGRPPRSVPAAWARAVTRALGGLPVPAVQGISRKLEMLWFGQAQNCSALVELGYAPTGEPDPWRRLAHQLASD